MTFALLYQAKQEVFGPDVVVLQPKSLAKRQLEDLLVREVKGGEPTAAPRAMSAVSL